MAAILKNRYYVITPPAMVWLRQNLACWCKITCRWLHMGQNWNEIEFQHGDRLFSQTVSSFISTVDWDISSTFGMHIDFHHFERKQSLNLNSEVDFRLHDRHLEKSIWRRCFYRAACNADAVLWWEFCPSVCPSVCLPVTRVYCDKTVERSVQIYIPYERTFSLVYREEEWLVGGDPFYLKFWVNRPPFERNRRFSTNNRS